MAAAAACAGLTSPAPRQLAAMTGTCARPALAAGIVCSATSRASSGAGTDAHMGDPVERTRQRMNYTNSWHRKPVDESQQFTWQTPMKQDAAVAIIGGGFSGLACGRGLARRGIRSTVFDTGEHGVGGRLGTRSSEDGSLHAESLPPELKGVDLMFDHAAQCFTATDPRFQAVVSSWEQRGLVVAWHSQQRPCVGTLQAPPPGSSSSSNGTYTPLPGDPPLYIAAGGMRSLAQAMAEEGGAVGRHMDVVRPMWVSRIAADARKGGWQLSGKNKGLGVYDAVVIAHNGKCANRLVGPTGAPLVAQQLMKLRLSAVWVVMAVFEQPLPVPEGMEGAFVSGSPVLSWVANNTAKFSHTNNQQQQQQHGLQCWTLISTNGYGQRNKVPQEMVPADVAAKVAGELMGELGRLLGQQLPAPLYFRCQLWGAALPLNSPKVSAILDPASRVGVCGDWLQGAGLQSAYLSGLALAEQLAELRGKDTATAAELAMGLRTPFQSLADSEIGEFPGVSTPAAAAPPKPAGRAPGGGRGRGERGPRQAGDRPSSSSSSSSSTRGRGGGRGTFGGRGGGPAPTRGGWKNLGTAAPAR